MCRGSNTKQQIFCYISGFRREVDESCALLGYCAASIADSFQTFRDKLSVPLQESLKYGAIVFTKRL